MKKPAAERPGADSSLMIKTVGGKLMSVEEWRRAAGRGATSTARPEKPAPAALQPRDLEAVFDALVVGGGPKGKTWVTLYLTASGHRNARGARLTGVEVAQALQDLAAAGRVRNQQGFGYAVPPQAIAERLPALLAGAGGGALWRWSLWAAGSGYGDPNDLPGWVHFRSPEEMIALARLMLHANGLSLATYQRLINGPLNAIGDRRVMFHALTEPFMPDAFGRMDEGLRLELLAAIDTLAGNRGADPLYDWVADWLARTSGKPPLHLCYRIADRRAQALDMAAMHAALRAYADTSIHDLFKAAELALAGNWADAASTFGAALKAQQALSKVRRGVVPISLAWIYPMALMAGPAPAGWAAARKFCVAESGSRAPSPHDAWGRWAHAAAVRLGDAALVPEAFLPRRSELEDGRFVNPTDAAHRLLLTAWLDLPAGDWDARTVNALQEALADARCHWLAKLVFQAGDRLGLAPLPIAARAAPATPEPAAFFGGRREAWRDALAAIAALGETPANPQSQQAATLVWQLHLDVDGRVIDVTPLERTHGPRGWSRPKPVSLAKVKKAPRLDPRDAAVARAIEPEPYGRMLRIDPAAAALALVQHPAVTLDEAREQMVELSEGLPILEVRRRPASAGVGESFTFSIDPPLLAGSETHAGTFLRSTEQDSAQARLNGIRVVREAPNRARLIRITPAQRRVAELIAKNWSVPVDAKEELDAALRVLSGLFQLHSDARAGEEVPGESRLRAQLSPQGDGLQLRLVVMPFGDFGPAVAPGAGRERVMALHQGLSLATVRSLDLELAHWRSVIEALPFLDDGSAPDAGWLLDDPEQALRAVEVLPTLAAVAALDWPRGKPLSVVPVDSPALGVKVASGRDWFALEGEVRVDAGRVLDLRRMLDLARDSKSRFVALGDGEYLALSERLRRQLADLDAAGRVEREQLRLPRAAAAWLDASLAGAQVAGDDPWKKRVAALAAAATLDPQAEGLHTELRTYQQEGFAWMARLAHAGLGACLADDMGLGKTVQTIALLLRRAGEGPALVLAPTSVCGNWMEEIARFAPGLNAYLYGQHDEGARTALVARCGRLDVVVAAYSLAHGTDAALASRPWGTLVMDEAQALKNAATQRARAVAGIDAGFRLALTGTPVENRLADLWSIMHLINPGFLGTASQFNEHFTGPIEKDRDITVRQRLRRLVSPFLLRRTKAQVLHDLPPRTEIIHRVEPSDEERHFLEALRQSATERVHKLDAEEGEASSLHVLAELTRLRRAACDPRLVAPELGIVGAKAQAFEQIVRELVDGQHKALVFSQFTGFLALLAERLDGCGIAYQHLDGSTPAAERSRRVQAFQRGEGEVFLISLKAGGFGLNLTAADYVIIVDPWWNPAAEDQAMGRAHRIGQERPVTVYRLVTAGSIEERIVELHQDKRSLADGILEGQDDAAPISAAVLRELLLDG
jgi:superfamily II DNA or RNA helicase